MSALVPQSVVGPYPTGYSANSLDISFAASNPSGDTFPSTGKELLLVYNSDDGAQTFSVTSQPDPYNRTMNITTYSLSAGEYAAFWFGSSTGWRDSDGNINLASSDATIKYAVLRLP